MEAINQSEFFIWDEKNSTEPSTKFGINGVSDAKITIIDTVNVSSEKSASDTTKRRESGIYKIVNRVDGKYYVGCSRNIQSRWIRHKSVLRKNKHENKYLQHAWNKYGEENFEHIIVETTEPHLLPITEQKYLDLCKLNKSNVYNLIFSTAFVPIRRNRSHLTVEHRKKLSIAHKSRDTKNYIGRKLSDETRRKISIAHLALPKGSEHPLFGIPRSAEVKRKMGEGRRNKSIFHWYNSTSNLHETCTGYNFRMKYDIKASKITDLISRRRKSYKGWAVIFSQDS